MGLKEAELYLKEEANPGIKKYKSVIKEYQKKYSSEVTSSGSSSGLSELFRKFMTPARVGKECPKDEAMMNYWIVEAMTMGAEVKKEELDAIIEGKNMPARDVLVQRLKSD